MPHARQLATGLFALAALLAPSAMSAAAAAPAGRLQHVPDVTGTGNAWAGYVIHGSTYKTVSGSWTQPAVKCTAGDQYSSYWVGLDGYDSDSIEQIGTEADCVNKVAEYSAWYEMYPAYPVDYTTTIKPGDEITASVAFSGTDTFTLTIKDTTEGWTKTATKVSSGDARSSAECIVSAPYSGEVLPVADFGTFTFDTCVVDGVSIISLDPIVSTMTGVTVSPVSSGHLSITWVS
jgi:hypothetical protein